VSKLKTRRRKLDLTLIKVRRECGVPQIIVLDLEESDRFRAHPAYEAYREELIQYYDRLDKQLEAR